MPILPRFLLAALLLLAIACPVQAQTGLFANPPVIPTVNGWPSAIYAADVNNDGYPDLIYIEHGATPGQPSTTHILLNDGHANFTPSATIATFGNSLAIGTISPSGHVDLAWVTVTPTNGLPGAAVYNYFVNIAAGKGDGTFTAPVATQYQPRNFAGGGYTGGTPAFGYLIAAHTHPTGPMDVLAEDLPNKTFLDFSTQNFGGTATFLGGRLTSFPNSNTGEFLADPGPITVADLNNDGYPDILINDQTSFTANVYLNTPSVNGRYLQNDSGTTPNVRSLLIAPYANNPYPSLIAEGTDGNLTIYSGNGDGTFATPGLTASGANVGAGGHLIAQTLSNTNGQQIFTATPIGISTLLSSGSAGTLAFGINGIYNAGPGRTSYAFADFNNDGHPDIAVDSPEGIALLFGSTDGSLYTSPTGGSSLLNKSRAAAAGQPALSVALAPFTQPPYLDAVVSTAATQGQLLPNQPGQQQVFQYQGFGTSQTPNPTTTQTGTPNLWSTVQAGDFNGDGNPDLILTADGANANLPATGSGLAVQLGRGDGTFLDPQPITVANQFTTPNPQTCTPPFDHYPGMFFGTTAIADFTGDGIPDIASRDASAYRILRGNTGTPGAVATQYPTLFFSGVDGTGTTVECEPHAHDRVLAADFNADGRPDIIFQHNGDLLLYLTDATGTPQPTGNLAVNGSLTTPGQATAPVLSTTFGGISPTFGFPAFIGSLAAADLDRDGNQDLLVLYHNMASDPTAPAAATPNYLYIWFGSGSGKFLTTPAHPVNPIITQLSRNYYQLAVADLNGDGIPDLILSDGYILSIQYGLPTGGLGPEVHFLAGQGINGIAVGDTRNTHHQDLVIANGGLTLSNPVVNHETLTPNPGANTGGITFLLNTITAKTTPTLNLTATPEPSYLGEPFTLTANLPPAATGNIIFTIDATSIDVPITPGTPTTLTAPPPTLALGPHTITAFYSGDTIYASTTITITHTIVLSPTTVTLTPTTPLASFYGQPADGTFEVDVLDGNHPANGTYTLLDNGIPAAICTALPITQSCPYGNPVFLDSGRHTFTIQYLGDQFNAPSLSSPVTYVISPDLTTATLTLATPIAPANTAVSFIATITGNYAVPNGQVNFFDGLNPIGSATLAPSGPNTASATFSTSTLFVGTHAINGTYPGNIDFNPVITGPHTQTITPVSTALPSVLTLTASLDPSAPGQAVVYTAFVTVPGPFPIIATGTITFAVDGTTIGAPLPLDTHASVILPVPTLASGNHTITAAYSGQTGTPTPIHPGDTPKAAATQGTPTIAPSTATLAHTITYPLSSGPDQFTMTITPNPITVGAGRTIPILVSILETGGFNQPVALSCSGLPNGSTCTFFGPIVPPGGASIDLQLATAAPHDCGDPANPYFVGASPTRTPVAFASLATLLLLTLSRKTRRHLRKLTAPLFLLTLAALLTTLSGCGHCTDLGTRPGTYTFTVTAVAQGAPITETRTQTIKLNVSIP